MIDKENVLTMITQYYLNSRDFNGIPYCDLIEQLSAEENEVIENLYELIHEGKIGIIFSDLEINPHIIRTSFEEIDVQVKHLKSSSIESSCIYPQTKHLETVVNKSDFSKTPYTLYLALGSPQLSYKSFDLSILESYRNDPRYYYKNNDISGSISIRDKYCKSDEMKKSDQVFLETFGFSYDKDFNRAVSVFLRYLSNLSPEHQNIWKNKEVSEDYELHPAYYQNSINGDWGERVPILAAFLKEIWLINQMSLAMGRPLLFRNDFGKFGEKRPEKLNFLVRPTLDEYNNFILLLDKMLSDNINIDFFMNDLSYETEETREDGKTVVHRKGTIQILDEWVRSHFIFNEDDIWNTSINVLRDIRKKRQKPAHSIEDNEFNQEYFKNQRKLIIDVYNSVRLLRMVFEGHPCVQASTIEVPEWLREGKIWNL